MEIRRKKRGAGIWPYLLLAPALLIMLSVVIIPIINAVSMSFQSYNLTRPKKIGFIAFQNYEKILQSSQFWSSMGPYRRVGALGRGPAICVWLRLGAAFEQEFPRPRRGALRKPHSLGYARRADRPHVALDSGRQLRRAQ